MITHAPRLRRLLAAATLLATSASASFALATTILPLDLDALTAAAGRVFKGRVTAVRSGRDARGLPATWTTFAVDEALKGALASTLEIKQLGVDTPLPDGTLFHVPALPSYRVGDEVILFLHPDSGDGFTSPVGFGQGRFRVRHENGRALAENDVGNGNLRAGAFGAAQSAAAAAPPAGAASPATVPGTRAAGAAAAIPVDELLARVRALTDATR